MSEKGSAFKLASIKAEYNPPPSVPSSWNQTVSNQQQSNFQPPNYSKPDDKHASYYFEDKVRKPAMREIHNLIFKFIPSNLSYSAKLDLAYIVIFFWSNVVSLIKSFVTRKPIEPQMARWKTLHVATVVLCFPDGSSPMTKEKMLNLFGPEAPYNSQYLTSDLKWLQDSIINAPDHSQPPKSITLLITNIFIKLTQKNVYTKLELEAWNTMSLSFLEDVISIGQLSEKLVKTPKYLIATIISTSRELLALPWSQDLDDVYQSDLQLPGERAFFSIQDNFKGVQQLLWQRYHSADITNCREIREMLNEHPKSFARSNEAPMQYPTTPNTPNTNNSGSGSFSGNNTQTYDAQTQEESTQSDDMDVIKG